MDKAEALNKQFFTFFTNEDQHVPTLESSPFPNIQELYFSIDGISHILKNLQINKAQNLAVFFSFQFPSKFISAHLRLGVH